jgi:protein O-mannosyl-transferase
LTREKVGGPLLVLLAAALVHGPSVAFGFTALDDRDFVVEGHAFLAQPRNWPRAFARSYMDVVDPEHPYYRPLVTLSYGLDAQWSGVRAFGYHFTNVVLHAAASLLFLALLRRLDFGRIAAGAGALVFCVHPMLASAVAWIPGRNDSLLAVFALGSWLLFLDVMARPSGPRLLGHLALYWLALLTKETAVALPLVCAVHVLLLDPQARTRLGRRRAALLVAGWAAGIAGRWLARPPVGGVASIEGVRGLTVLAASLGQLALPIGPSAFTVPEDLLVWPGLLAAALVAASSRFLPGVRPRVVVLGLAVFVVFLAPALAVPGTLVLSSRLYLPACGAIVAIAEIVRRLPLERAGLLAFTGAAIVVLAGVTLAYEGTFRDRRAFARNAVAAAPHSSLAHFCLGQTYQIDGDADRALAEYRTALALGAVYGVHNNIAVIHMASARWPEAERELREELAGDPRAARAHRNLAVVLRGEGRFEEARAADERAGAIAAGEAEAR